MKTTKEKDLYRLENIKEIDYPPVMIKRITPYLDNLTYTIYPGTDQEREKKLPKKYRAFAWYYVYNNGNKSDAYRRAYFSKYNFNTNKLVLDNEINAMSVGAGANRLFKNGSVREAINLIRKEIEKQIRIESPQTMLEQLQAQATYDPAMFINIDGTPAFKKWSDIPPKYRCCIVSIKPKRYGKDGYKDIVVELVDRKEARDKLLQLAPEMLSPEKSELVLLTKNDKGEEVGLNTDLSDDELRNIIAGGA